MDKIRLIRWGHQSAVREPKTERREEKEDIVCLYYIIYFGLICQLILPKVVSLIKMYSCVNMNTHLNAEHVSKGNVSAYKWTSPIATWTLEKIKYTKLHG